MKCNKCDDTGKIEIREAGNWSISRCHKCDPLMIEFNKLNIKRYQAYLHNAPNDSADVDLITKENDLHTNYQQPLIEFVMESNKIEGIEREPSAGELEAHHKLIFLDRLTVEDITNFVDIISKAKLRKEFGMDVRIGNYHPIPGGPEVELRLKDLIRNINTENGPDPYANHCKYESLHPFMDGNGRSGRAIWLWEMFAKYGIIPPLGFLHTWYYQSLNQRKK